MSVARPDRNISNRITVAVCAVLVEACLGAIPAGSFYAAALEASQAQWVPAAAMVLFAAGVLLSGVLLGRFGARKLVLAGGGLLGGGLIMAGILGTGFPVPLACLGIVGGFGAGLAYVVPILIGMKWYPDKRGFIVGVILCGGVFGSIIWTGLAGSWFDLIRTLSLFGLDGLRSVLILYGIGFLVIVLPAGSALAEPPWGYAQAGWTGSQSGGTPGTGVVHFEPQEMVRMPQFALLFAAFFLSVAAAFVASLDIGLFGLNALNARGLEPRISEAVAGWAAGSLVFLIGVGQCAWGSVSDIVGRRFSLAILCLVQAVVLSVLYKAGGDPKALIFCACVIGFNLGGCFTLFPVTAAEYFGTRNFGLNYGILFIAATLAGLIGTALAGHVGGLVRESLPATSMQDTIPPLQGIWLSVFLMAGAASLVSAALVFFARPPRKEVSRFEAIMRFRERTESVIQGKPEEEPGQTDPAPENISVQD